MVLLALVAKITSKEEYYFFSSKVSGLKITTFIFCENPTAFPYLCAWK